MAKDTSKREQVSTGSRKLRYEMAYDLVLEHIASHKLKPGDRLPTAAELVKLCGVSMISVRHALSKLESEGKVRRHQGVGTFVTGGRIMSEPNRSGEMLLRLTESDQKPDLSTEVIHIGIGLPSDAVVKALSIEAGQPVWEVFRRRCMKSHPVILEQAILPLSLVPHLDIDYLQRGGSLYRFLVETHKLYDEHSEQFFEVVQPTKVEREQLGLTAHDSVVRIRGVSYTAEGIAFDCWQQIYRASDFIFYSTGSGNRRLLQPVDIGVYEVQPLTASGGGSEATAGNGKRT